MWKHPYFCRVSRKQAALRSVRQLCLCPVPSGVSAWLCALCGGVRTHLTGPLALFLRLARSCLIISDLARNSYMERLVEQKHESWLVPKPLFHPSCARRSCPAGWRHTPYKRMKADRQCAFSFQASWSLFLHLPC